MPDDNNGRITLAVLGEKLDATELLMVTKIDNVKSLLVAQIDLNTVSHLDHEDRIRVVENKVTTLDQRVGHLTGIFGVLQGSLIAVVTWLGLK